MKVRTEARRDAILAVASQVFLEKGFERASMSEIAQRVGGSKATLYGYFSSKENLFLAVTLAEGKKHVDAALSDLTSQGAETLQSALTGFGKAILTFLTLTSTCAAHRMVIGEAGRSDIGQKFYEAGPKMGVMKVAEALQAAMERGQLRRADPIVAAQHLLALINAEVQDRWFYRDKPPLTPVKARQMAERSIDVFLRGYAI